MKEIFINKHIKLKKLKEKDINENYLSWFKDVTINANLVNINYKSVDQLKRYFAKTIKKKNLFFFGIFFKGKHIGNIKFENIYINSPKASWGILVGDKSFRGKRVGYHVLSKSMETGTNITSFTRPSTAAAIDVFNAPNFGVNVLPVRLLVPSRKNSTDLSYKN